MNNQTVFELIDIEFDAHGNKSVAILDNSKDQIWLWVGAVVEFIERGGIVKNAVVRNGELFTL